MSKAIERELLAQGAESPVTFLVGAERSGTTLLRLMLDGHPELAFRYEFELAVDLVSDDGTWPELDAYYEFLRTFRWVDPPPYVDRSLAYPALVRSFLEQKRRADGKPRVGAVVHRHYGRLLHLWPDARFVHIVRDPRDVARSCLGMGWAGNVWTGVELWVEAERLWEHVRAGLPAHRYLEIRYEDLVLDTRGVLRRICAFMGLDCGDAALDAMLEYPSRSIYTAPDRSLVEQWRRKLSTRQIQLVEERTHAMLVPRGYAPSGLPPIRLTSLERALLRAHCRARRAQWAARTYGTKLWLERVVTNRVGPKRWRESVIQRENAILNEHIARVV